LKNMELILSALSYFGMIQTLSKYPQKRLMNPER